LVVASMVGTGVFTTTGLVLGSIGSPLVVLAVWIASGILALAGATVYAELGAMMPRAGGEYVYLSRAIHPLAGFLIGWVSVLVGFAAPIAASALAFATYLKTLVPGTPVKPAAVALIATVTALHARNVRRGGAVQAALTALTVALILILIGGAVISGRVVWSRLWGAGGATPTAPVSAGAVAVALVYVGYSYCGWNAAAYVAGELREPGRTLPRALLGGTALVTVLYVGLNVVFMASVPKEIMAGRVEVADIAARTLFGPGGGGALSALVTLVLAGSVSALVMTGARVLQAMAADGFFFHAVSRTTAGGAPFVAVLFLGALAVMAAATASFEPLLVYAGFTLTLGSAATIVAAFVLRRRAPDMPRPYRAMAWPASGVAYLGLALFISSFAVRERPVESLTGLATLLAGGVAALFWRRAPVTDAPSHGQR
jgi:APA family basic amino acid/polyamine antiporter